MRIIGKLACGLELALLFGCGSEMDDTVAEPNQALNLLPVTPAASPRIHRVKGTPASLDSSGSCLGTIGYHGGPVMLGTTNLYYIWYGNWYDNTATTILTDFANSIGGSRYYFINTTYYDGSENHVANAVHFAGSTTDKYSRGNAIDDNDVQIIVANAIQSGRLPLDPNGVYFVLTSADVNETTGFCMQYCGWHTYSTIGGANIKYSFVGNTERCIGACAAQAIGPNGNAGADGMASVIAHELDETVTDPNLNAWQDGSYCENADACEWTFGGTYPTPNGAIANVHLGSRDYLIQQNWLNNGQGYCTLTQDPDFFPSLSTVAPSWCGSSGGAGCLSSAANHVVVGDFNKDGRTDFMSANGNFDTWLSSGDGTFKYGAGTAAPSWCGSSGAAGCLSSAANHVVVGDS